MPNCKYCGASVSDDSTFCSYCGKAIIPDNFVYNLDLGATTKTKKKKGHAVASLVLALLSVLLCILYICSATVFTLILSSLSPQIFLILECIIIFVAFVFALLAFIFAITAFAAQRRITAGVIGMVLSLVALVYSGWQISTIIIALL